MRIIDTLKKKMGNALPGLRTTDNGLIQQFYRDYGWGLGTSDKPSGDFDLYFKAGNNVYVYRSIQVIIETLLGTGFTINNPDTTGKANIARKNYLTNLFNNPMGFDKEQTFAMFHTQYCRSFLLTGDAFIEVKENANFDSVIEGFEFIPPELMQYDYETDQWGIRNTKIRYEPSQLIHIYEPDIKLKGFKWGISKIDKIGFAIALLFKGLQYNQDIFENEGLDPRAVLSFDSGTSYENFSQELKRLEQIKNDPKLNKGTLAVKGANFQSAGVSNRDMDFLNLMNFARDMIITAYGVQPSKVGVRETASLGTGTGESQDKDFKDVVNGIARYIEDGFNKSLGRHSFEEMFSYDDLDIENKLQRAQIEDIQLKNGTRIVNEVRSGYALDPVKYGDVPMNYTSYGKPNDPLNPNGAIPYAETESVKDLTNVEIQKSLENIQKYKTELYKSGQLKEW